MSLQGLMVQFNKYTE